MLRLRKLRLCWVLVAGLGLTSVAIASPDDELSQRLAAQVAHWYERAEQGDANALFNLGQYFRKGIGIEKDLQQAQLFYQRAAELGHAEAQLNLGTLYYFSGETPDYEQTRRWWLASARQGNADAQYQLAILYLKQPEPLPLDALAWMTLAARSGDTQAVKAEQQLSQQLTFSRPILQQRIAQLGAVQPSVAKPGKTGVEPPVMPEHLDSRPDSPEVSPEVVTAAAVTAKTPAVEQTGTTEIVADRLLENTPQAISPARMPVREHVSVGRQKPASGYAVQLASLSDLASARVLQQRVQERFGDLLATHEVAVLPVAEVYKVRVTGFANRVAADELCKALQQQQQSCFLVKG